MNKNDKAEFETIMSYIAKRIQSLESDRRVLTKYHLQSDLLNEHLSDLTEIRRFIGLALVRK